MRSNKMNPSSDSQKQCKENEKNQFLTIRELKEEIAKYDSAEFIMTVPIGGARDVL